MAAVHAFCWLTMMIQQYATERFFEFVQIIQIAAMVSLIFNVTKICEYLILEQSTGIDMSTQYDQFKYWLFIEIIVFASSICSNCIYLLIRSFFIQKITLSVSNLKDNINTDFLEAQVFMLSIFLTFIVPVAVLTFIKNEC
jgi:hypothetical protein